MSFMPITMKINCEPCSDNNSFISAKHRYNIFQILNYAICPQVSEYANCSNTVVFCSTSQFGSVILVL